jgi:hypothetical protein
MTMQNNFGSFQKKYYQQKAKHNRFHAGPPAWIERKFTFLLRLFKLKMSEYTLKIGICRNLKKSPKII